MPRWVVIVAEGLCIALCLVMSAVSFHLTWQSGDWSMVWMAFVFGIPAVIAASSPTRR